MPAPELAEVSDIRPDTTSGEEDGGVPDILPPGPPELALGGSTDPPTAVTHTEKARGSTEEANDTSPVRKKRNATVTISQPTKETVISTKLEKEVEMEMEGSNVETEGEYQPKQEILLSGQRLDGEAISNVPSTQEQGTDIQTISQLLHTEKDSAPINQGLEQENVLPGQQLHRETAQSNSDRDEEVVTAPPSNHERFSKQQQLEEGDHNAGQGLQVETDAMSQGNEESSSQAAEDDPAPSQRAEERLVSGYQLMTESSEDDLILAREVTVFATTTGEMVEFSSSSQLSQSEGGGRRGRGRGRGRERKRERSRSRRTGRPRGRPRKRQMPEIVERDDSLDDSQHFENVVGQPEESESEMEWERGGRGKQRAKLSFETEDSEDDMQGKDEDRSDWRSKGNTARRRKERGRGRGRGRGRPRRRPAIKRDESLSDGSIAGRLMSSSGPEVETGRARPPRRKRGRPRKRPLPEREGGVMGELSPPEPQAIQSGVAGETSTVARRRGRGRGKRGRPRSRARGSAPRLPTLFVPVVQSGNWSTSWVPTSENRSSPLPPVNTSDSRETGENREVGGGVEEGERIAQEVPCETQHGDLSAKAGGVGTNIVAAVNTETGDVNTGSGGLEPPSDLIDSNTGGHPSVENDTEVKQTNNDGGKGTETESNDGGKGTETESNDGGKGTETESNDGAKGTETESNHGGQGAVIGGSQSSTEGSQRTETETNDGGQEGAGEQQQKNDGGRLLERIVESLVERSHGGASVGRRGRGRGRGGQKRKTLTARKPSQKLAMVEREEEEVGWLVNLIRALIGMCDCEWKTAGVQGTFPAFLGAFSWPCMASPSPTPPHARPAPRVAFLVSMHLVAMSDFLKFPAVKGRGSFVLI